MMYGCGVLVILAFLFFFPTYESQWFDSSQAASQGSQNKIDDFDSGDSIVLSQSDVCSQTDDLKKIQCFREIPLPKYEVFEGEDVLMRCRVAYQKGKLQWAFKGKMLGFDRDIPNYPRMRMPGNPEIGDHSIFIENTTLSDSGTYECQLSPSSSQQPRRRMTKLIVLRAPMWPAIYLDRTLSKDKIVVSIKRDELDFAVNLTCVAYGGNPPPTFEWNINGSRLQSSSVYRFARTNITMLNESASLLSLWSHQIWNNDVISCGVFNVATRKRPKLDERILLTKIRVFKRILAGALQLKDVESKSVTVDEKEQLRLSCVTNDPGDPPIKLMWKSALLNQSISKYMMTNVENPFQSQATITIPSVDLMWHRASLVCDGTQEGLKASSEISATIFVKHLPSKLNLVATSVQTNNTLDNPAVVYLTDHQIIKLICTTSTFYSQNLKIVWFAKITEQSEWRKVTESSEKVIEIDDGRLQMLKSVLEITPSLFNKNAPNKFRIIVVCILRSPDSSGEKRKQIRLETFELPSSPIISINDDLKSPELINGQSVKIKCTTTGGHPSPDLTLVDALDNEVLSRKCYPLITCITEYTLEVQDADNGRKFRCLASFKDTLDIMTLSTNFVMLTVAISPKLITMKVPGSPFRHLSGNVLSLYCSTDSSVPQAKIEWLWHHSCRLGHVKASRANRLSAKDIRQYCESEIIEDNNISTYDVSSQSTTSSVNIRLLPSHDLTFIECHVLPHHKWSTFKNDLSKIYYLKVQYLPIFPPELKKIYTVEEGQILIIKINASSNPLINGYSWLLNGLPITRKSQIELKVDKFSVLKAVHHMMGNYTLILENHLGKTSFSIFLNVTFAPKLLGPSIETLKLNPLKDYRQKTSITCSAQANPFMEQTHVQWFREPSLVMDHYDLVNSLQGESLFTKSPQVHCAKGHWSMANVTVNCISLGAIEVVSILQVMPTDHRYIGSYKCVFSNPIKPSSAVKTTHFVYPTIPVAIRNKRKSEYTVKLGGKTQIACYFVAFPKPSIMWIRFPNFRCSEDTAKYATSISTPQTGLIKAVLAIRETNDSDIGTYVCNAQNQYGKSSHLVLLERPHSPVQPMNFTVMNVTETSITVGWIVGFNGGSKQTIELRWTPYDIGRDSQYSYMEFGENEDSDVQSFTITDLQSQKEYEILLQSRNRYSISTENPSQVFVKTMKYDSEGEFIQSDGRTFNNKGNKGKRVKENTERNNLLIIIILSTIGGLLVGLKIGLLTYFIRRKISKRQKSLDKMDKMSTPRSQRITNGYLTSADSMEMRAPSLIRSAIESNMYAQSVSDQMSQNGSDSGLKMSYYKTDEAKYLSPELDLVASAMGRNHYNAKGASPNFHPAYIQLAESPPITGYPESYLTGYYANKPIFYNQTPTRMIIKRSPNHSVLDANIASQYSNSSNFPKNYPSSAVSISTASGDSNRSRSPNIKNPGYSPMIGPSTAPSTVDEYLSSINSGSEYNRSSLNNLEPYSVAMTSFRLNKTDHSDLPKQTISPQEPLLEIPSHEMNFSHGVDFHYSLMSDRRRKSTNSEREQLLKPPHGVYSVDMKKDEDAFRDRDFVSHSSPSVIRFNGIFSETL